MRQRRTKADMSDLRYRIMQVVEEDSPLTVRQLYYRLTDPTHPHVDKTEQGYACIQRLALEMRRNRIIHYSHIVDQSRTYFDFGGFDGVGTADFIDEAQRIYRRNYWRDSMFQPQIWCESRSISGIIQSVCNRWGVNLYPCGGFPSESFIWQAAQEIIESGKDTLIYYIGDYDPSGLAIDIDLEHRLKAFVAEADIAIDVEFERVAITREQIDYYDLPSKPVKESKHNSMGLVSSVEAEAMPAPILRDVLNDYLAALMPETVLKGWKQVEAMERYDLAERLKGVDTQA